MKFTGLTKPHVGTTAFYGAETYSGLEYQYTPNGHLEAAIESRGSASVTVERYRITAKDARGQVTGLSKGGIGVSRTYAPDTGRLTGIYAQNLLTTTIQDLSVDWDVLGNLTDKVDSHRALSEQYDYDALNRLTSVSGSSSLSLTYDGLGNIASKSDVGSYSYGSKPHAVTSDGTRSFTYDGNGNLVSGTDGRTNSYTVFNKPYAMSRAGSTVTIDYGPNRERYRRLDNVSGQVTVTHYVGSIEKITRPGPIVEIKRYLDGEAIETITDSTRTTQYLFTDHLGSVDVITNASGTVVQSMAFDAFGRRRDAVDYDAFTDPMLFTFDTTKTTRGFTFHEQLDPVGLIHMNGRVYDPTLGRFLSPDPFVQHPGNTQSLNRYSYVFNNPLSYTDPSGYLSLKDGLKIGAAVVAGAVTSGAALSWLAATYGTAITAGGSIIAYSVSTAQYIGFSALAGAAGGFVSGGILSGSVQGAVSGAFTGAAFGAIGGWSFAAAVEPATAVFAHAVAGGVLAEIQGGDFGHGFASAGLARSIDPGAVFDGGDLGAVIGRTVVAAVVGGTASRITGGSFENGAVTAGFANLFNREVHAADQARREKLEAEIRRMEASGVLSDRQTFETRDDAAQYVLNAVTRLAHEFNLEVGGRIWVDQDGSYHYSIPTVGSRGRVTTRASTEDFGYHTHPNGLLIFSAAGNSSEYPVDSVLVNQGYISGLYLGVYRANGTVGIAACERGNCPNVTADRQGPRGRVIQ